MIHNDEILARRLQAELNQATPSRRSRPVSPIRQTPTRVVASSNSLNTGRLEDCTHHCDLVSTRQCCTCSGKRNIFINAILLLT